MHRERPRVNGGQVAQRTFVDDMFPVKHVVVGLTPTVTAWGSSRSITLKRPDTLATVVLGAGEHGSGEAAPTVLT